MITNLDIVILAFLGWAALMLGVAIGRGIRGWILFFRTLPPKPSPPPSAPQSVPFRPPSGPPWVNGRSWEAEHLRDTRYGAPVSDKATRTPPPPPLDEDNEVVEFVDEKDLFI